MKRKFALMACFLILPLILAFAPAVKAPNGHPPFGWVEPDYAGLDYYYNPPYGEYIVGYLEETYWNLSMSWTNYGANPINISAIRIYFDWGKNYTHSFDTPIQVMPDETRVFTVYNMTPPVEEAPESWLHYYVIYIDHVNSTTPPYEELSPIWFWSDGDFAVLSQDHLDCLIYWSKYMMFFEEGPMPFYTNISKVQVLLMQAMFELSQGIQIYTTGIFGTAKEHLANADSLFDEALTVWDERGTAMEDSNRNYQDAQASYYNAQANYYNVLGDAARTNAYGWLLFGLGWVFIGIGLIVYAIKKPKAS